MSDDKTRPAAYVPWKTFRNSLDRFQQGLPNQIDKSVFTGLAGGTQTHLLAAMKFLDLIDDKGIPTPKLRELVAADEVRRKPLLKKMLEESYPELIALGLRRATGDQLNERMETCYSVVGSTRQKAVRFFLQGAEEAGLELSPFLKKATATNGSGKTTTSGAPRRRRTKAKKGPADSSAPTAAASGSAKVLQLASGGGSVTLAYSVDLFSLSPTDRSFVIELITKLEEYEAAHPPKKPKAPHAERAAGEETEEREEGDQE